MRIEPTLDECIEALIKIRDEAFASDDGSIWMDDRTPIGLYVDMIVNQGYEGEYR